MDFCVHAATFLLFSQSMAVKFIHIYSGTCQCSDTSFKCIILRSMLCNSVTALSVKVLKKKKAFLKPYWTRAS